MGFGTTLRTNIYYSHATYTSKEEVLEAIELQERIIKGCEDELMQLVVMTEPAKFWRESEAEVGETPWIWMQNEARQCIESIKESQTELDNLQLLLYRWDECHDVNGNAIESPKTDSDGTYMWGDFINSVYPDGTEAHNYRKDIFGK